MTLAEILTLSKAGYKKKDIDAIIAAEAEEKKVEEPEAQAPIEEPKVEEVKEPEVDYKQLYEQSQEALKAAQQANLRTTVSTTDTSDEDVLMKLVNDL